MRSVAVPAVGIVTVLSEAIVLEEHETAESMSDCLGKRNHPFKSTGECHNERL